MTVVMFVKAFFVKYFILCFAFPLFAHGFSRSIKTHYNPGFSANCTNEGFHLIYAKAVSNSNKDDILHYVVTAGKPGPPTVMLISTQGAHAELIFNCSNILSDNIAKRVAGIKVSSGKTIFTAGFLVSRLWQYNDTKNVANMTKYAHQNISKWYPMENFVWSINSAEDIANTKTILLKTNQTAEDQFLDLPNDEAFQDASFASNASTTAAPTPTPAPNPSGHLFRRGGHVMLSIVLSDQQVRRDMQPRLYFTGNSTQLDVTLNQLNSAFSAARFGLTLVHMSSLDSNDAMMKVDESRSIDDEFTPGIFKILDWKSYPKSKKNVEELHKRAFLQWKPICYTSVKRSLSASEQMYYFKPPTSKMDPFDSDMIRRSIAYPWFNSQNTNQYEAKSLNISFGQTDDGFYLKSNFTVWSSSMGLGEPPVDEVSLLVILVIAIGLGTPFVIIVAGFVIVVCRRRRASTESSAAVYPVIN